MVAKSRKVLKSDRHEADDDKIVIDLGAPRLDLAAPRVQEFTLKGGRGLHSHPAALHTRPPTPATATPFHNPLGKFVDQFNRVATPTQTEKSRRRVRRRAVASDLYVPNPRLYQSKPAGKKTAATVKNKRAKRTRSQSQSPKRTLTRHQSQKRTLTREQSPERTLTRHQSPVRTLIRHQSPERTLTLHQSPERTRTRHQGSQRTLTLHQSPKRTLTRHQTPKRIRKRSQSSKRVAKRHKRKTRRTIPNRRLYQPPPPRLLFVSPPPPPKQPQEGWLPSSDTAPQKTASQIALLFSNREVPVQREPLPAAKKPVIQICNSQLPPHPTPRDRIWEMVSAVHARNANRNTVEQKRSPFTLSTERRPGKKVKENNSHARYKNGAPKVRPGVHTHFLPKEGSLEQVRYPSNIPNLDDSPAISSEDIPWPKYQPKSNHFRLRTLVSDTSAVSTDAGRPPAARVPNSARLMEAKMAEAPHSSPEVSDGNDSMSAPSEYLAEFLSAIMSRNYAEALKYCRLILHYEPNNTTARGFYPLLKYKLGMSKSPVSHAAKYGKQREMYWKKDGKVVNASNSDTSSGEASAVGKSGITPEVLEDLDNSSYSEAESLSPDSSGKCTRSPSPAERGDTDSSESDHSPETLGVTDVRALGATWLADANGNPRAESKKHSKQNRYSEDEDDENDNGDHRLVLQDADLRQLRAQFACSIK